MSSGRDVEVSQDDVYLSAAQQAVAADGRSRRDLSRRSCRSRVLRCGLLMRPQLNGGTLGARRLF
jgi:hypothetical protein